MRRSLALAAPVVGGWYRYLVALTSGALVLFLAAQAAAYCLAVVKAHEPWPKWRDQPVTYRVSENLTDAKILEAIDAAFTTWGSVPCSRLKFSKGPTFKPCLAEPCAPDAVKFEHSNKEILIFWVTTAWDKFGTSPAAPAALFFGQDNIGGIVSASIGVNAKDYKLVTDLTGCTAPTFDAQDYFMPLIGGVIGLATSNVAGSVMDGKPKYCSTAKRTLTADDKNGLYYHYSDGTCPTPPQPTSTGCSAEGQPADDRGPQPPKGDGGAPPDSSAGLPDGSAPPQCTADQQCAPGEVCDSTGHCVKPGGEDGCCRVGHARSAPGRAAAALVALLALLVLGLRRRR